MITTVTGKHQITIPAKLASAMGIVPGSRLEWQPTTQPSVIRVRVLPDRKAIANGLLGAGREFLASSAAAKSSR
jgi:bifunctional DNA-binding transcriptional regulator/antitoxin component of YhaV-PrlF toxin-antitoxin module